MVKMCHVRFLSNREPTKPNYDAPWPAKAEAPGGADIKEVCS